MKDYLLVTLLTVSYFFCNNIQIYLLLTFLFVLFVWKNNWNPHNILLLHSGVFGQTTNNILPLNSHVPLSTHLSPLTPAEATHVRRTASVPFQSQLGDKNQLVFKDFFYCLFNSYTFLTWRLTNVYQKSIDFASQMSLSQTNFPTSSSSLGVLTTPISQESIGKERLYLYYKSHRRKSEGVCNSIMLFSTQLAILIV